MSLLDWFRQSGAAEPDAEADTDSATTRGVRSLSVLTDPLIREALKAREAQAIVAFEAAKTDEELRKSREMLDAAKAFALYLRGIIGKGQAEATRAQQQEAARERMRVA